MQHKDGRWIDLYSSEDVKRYFKWLYHLRGWAAGNYFGLNYTHHLPGVVAHSLFYELLPDYLAGEVAKYAAWLMDAFKKCDIKRLCLDRSRVRRPKSNVPVGTKDYAYLQFQPYQCRFMMQFDPPSKSGAARPITFTDLLAQRESESTLQQDDQPANLGLDNVPYLNVESTEDAGVVETVTEDTCDYLDLETEDIDVPDVAAEGAEVPQQDKSRPKRPLSKIQIKEFELRKDFPKQTQRAKKLERDVRTVRRIGEKTDWTLAQEIQRRWQEEHNKS